MRPVRVMVKVASTPSATELLTAATAMAAGSSSSTVTGSATGSRSVYSEAAPENVCVSSTWSSSASSSWAADTVTCWVLFQSVVVNVSGGVELRVMSPLALMVTVTSADGATLSFAV